ncbi:helix-turn-helix transcriptional regulator [Streptomyces prunicolor]|uniref:helix-turn-helix transcriptional regulator n=1 Tax=Streptomyces prunicolor TaxID=67348 RepID=UPI00344AEAD5
MTATVTARINSRMRLRSDLPAPEQRRSIREAVGISQQELADIVGVSRQAVTAWEAGDRYPRKAQLARYVEALTALKAAAA